jgi:hypothetical protein
MTNPIKARLELEVAEPFNHRTFIRTQGADLVSEIIINRPQSNRIPIAVLFAVLWAGGMVLRAPMIDLQTVVTAVVAGAIVGGLMYWLFDKFRARS